MLRCNQEETAPFICAPAMAGNTTAQEAVCTVIRSGHAEAMVKRPPAVLSWVMLEPLL